jgi:hypothetical protein
MMDKHSGAHDRVADLMAMHMGSLDEDVLGEIAGTFDADGSIGIYPHGRRLSELEQLVYDPSRHLTFNAVFEIVLHKGDRESARALNQKWFGVRAGRALLAASGLGRGAPPRRSGRSASRHACVRPTDQRLPPPPHPPHPPWSPAGPGAREGVQEHRADQPPGRPRPHRGEVRRRYAVAGRHRRGHALAGGLWGRQT